MREFLHNLNIEYVNLDIYIQSITHPSYENEHPQAKNNQRLEFLGDAIFDVVVSEFLFTNESLNEGDMTKRRAMYVCEKALCRYAAAIKLETVIKVGKGVGEISDAILADAFESFIAAIYIDLGIDKVKEFCKIYIFPALSTGEFEIIDYKSKLQELVQVDKRAVEYTQINRSGPSHEPVFEIGVYLDGILLGSGIGKSKKLAEQNAAKSALSKMAGYSESKFEVK